MTSSPFERSVTSFAIASNATAEDSGGGVTCAKTSFFGVAWAKAGALASATTPAAPAACNTRRRVVASCERDLVIGVFPIDSLVAATIAAEPVPATEARTGGATGHHRRDRPLFCS